MYAHLTFFLVEYSYLTMTSRVMRTKDRVYFCILITLSVLISSLRTHSAMKFFKYDMTILICKLLEFLTNEKKKFQDIYRCSVNT
jgi:hypothetical protein